MPRPRPLHPHSNLNIALDLASAGIFIFPAIVRWNENAGKLDKKPAIKEWQTAATVDPSQLRQWWQTFPDAVPAVELSRSKLFVGDLDRHPGAPDGVAAFQIIRGSYPVPDCPSIRTPSDGYHLYFKQPDGEPLGNGRGNLPDGIDVRGAGGWTVAPGAMFQEWRWRENPLNRLSVAYRAQTLSAPPEWFLAIIRTKQSRPDTSQQPPGPVGKRECAYAERALASEAARLAAVGAGKRNTELNNSAFRMGHLVASGWIGRSTVEGRLLDAVIANGLVADDGEQAAKDTIKSGIDAGLKELHAPLADKFGRDSKPPNKSDADANGTWKDGIFTAKQLQSMTFDPIAWVLPQIIPAEGVTLLCAKPKFGKSWLAYDLCLAATADRFTLGTFKPAQGDVLYCALEDSQRRLQRRMQKLLPGFSGQWTDRLTITTRWRRLHEGGLDDIRAWHEHTKEAGKPILVVVDVLAKVRRPTGNRPTYEADYEALTGLTQLANELHMAVIVIHHTRKLAADDLMETVSGSFGLTGAVDTVLVMANKASGSVLDVRGRDVESAEFAVQFNAETCRWTVLGAAAEVHVSEQRAKVIAALKEADAPMTVAALMQATWMKRNALDLLLGRMAKVGEINRVKTGLYAHKDWTPPTEPEKPSKDRSVISIRDRQMRRQMNDAAQTAESKENNSDFCQSVASVRPGTSESNGGHRVPHATEPVPTQTDRTGRQIETESIEKPMASGTDIDLSGADGVETDETETDPLILSEGQLVNGEPPGVMVANGCAISHSPEDRKPGPSVRVWFREIHHPPISAGPDDDLNDFATI